MPTISALSNTNGGRIEELFRAVNPSGNVVNFPAGILWEPYSIIYVYVKFTSTSSGSSSLSLRSGETNVLSLYAYSNSLGTHAHTFVITNFDNNITSACVNVVNGYVAPADLKLVNNFCLNGLGSYATIQELRVGRIKF
jgi:hypothetical protein